jgi:hypothetical protein
MVRNAMKIPFFVTYMSAAGIPDEPAWLRPRIWK